MTPRQRATWLAVATAACPVALLLARCGLTLPVTSAVRDIAWLLAFALCEELVFRGGVQHALQGFSAMRQRVLLISAANLVTSLAFAGAHLYSHTPLQALAVLPVSLLLGLSYEQSGRLWLPTALHAWFNLALYGASALAATTLAASTV